MHAGHAATHPTHGIAGAPEPTDPLPSRRETAAQAAAPTSLAGAAAFFFPKANVTAPVRCAAIQSRRIEEVPADGGGGGLGIHVHDVFSLPASASTLGCRSPLHSREGQRDIQDLASPLLLGLSLPLAVPPPPRQAGYLLAPPRHLVDRGLPGTWRWPQHPSTPPEVFFWAHILFLHA